VLDAGARVGIVRRESTIRGRRGWLAARLDTDTGVPLPAPATLAVAAGSPLWRAHDLAAGAIARNVTTRRPGRRHR
jgi:hypothetical protein